MAKAEIEVETKVICTQCNREAEHALCNSHMSVRDRVRYDAGKAEGEEEV